MEKIVNFIEKREGSFEKISKNNYMMAIKDGFIATMPLVMFSSLLMIIIMIPKNFGITLPQGAIDWMNRIYSLTMGVIGMIVAGTVAKSLAGNFNRFMKNGKFINETSAMIAAICSYLVLSVALITDEKLGLSGISTDFLGAQGLISSFVAAFICVNVYKFCIVKNITLKMPKEVPGAIAQAFKDIFPFALSVSICGVLDILSQSTLGVRFAQSLQNTLQPLFVGAESYPVMMFIWFACALLWFVGIHGPSIVLPAVTSLQLLNMEENARLLAAGQFPYHALTPNFGNFIAAIGGTGATFIVPFLLVFFMKSKQLKSIGKASLLPVMFAVNEPLIFGMPIILNPYMFVPFLITPAVNTLIGKLFIDFLGMRGFAYQLPWAFPGPLGILVNTNFQLISFVLIAVLLLVDALIYFPFLKSYDKSLLEKENEKAEIIEEEEKIEEHIAAEEAEEAEEEVIDSKVQNEEVKVLVICAGSGTSTQLANAINDGANAKNAKILANSASYGGHYDIMKNYDMIILAPQVRSYYKEMKNDADKYGIKLLTTDGMTYIELTNDSDKALKYVLDNLK